MPKEFVRKRGGKRNAKKEDPEIKEEEVIPTSQIEAGPSTGLPFFIDTAGDHGESHRIVPVVPPQENMTVGELDPAAPFGLLDPDIKAYLISVDEKLREWENLMVSNTDDAETELEDRTTFLHSSLSEVRGLELKLSTDNDCALIMERLLHSMGDWGRRVLAESFTGNWSTLLQHRFGSHVCQTLLALAAETIDRESRQLFPKQHKDQTKALAQDPSIGTLPTMTQLISAMAEEILPMLPTLLISAFASPPVRLLLVLLSPGRAIPSTSSDSTDEGDKRIRSKKSQKYRNRAAGKMKSVLDGKEIADDGGGGESGVGGGSTRRGSGKERVVPDGLRSMRVKIRENLTRRLGGNEWRAMGVNSVGGPAVQILLELEAEDGKCEQEGSILDHLTSGLISTTTDEPEAQDYIPSLLRDTHGSHLLQAMLEYSPKTSFDKIWKVYFISRIGKLAGHPTGNFVVASGIGRLDEAGLKVAIAEIHGFGASTLIRTSRLAALTALVERASAENIAEQEVVDLICEAHELGDDRSLLVHCALTLNVTKSYQNAVKVAKGETVPDEDEAELEEEQHGWKPRRPKKVRGSLEPSMQGALLLQSMLRMHAPAVVVVLDSLFRMKTDELLALAHNPISSHVLDALLNSPTIPAKYRRRFILAFIGHYFPLADDCFGSRVADTIWLRSDGFLKEKIARSMLPKAIQLGNSKYGRFFGKKLNLQLLERRPDEWREMQLGVVHHFNGPRLATTHMKGKEEAKSESVTKTTNGGGGDAISSTDAMASEVEGSKKRKREKKARDESETNPETAVIDDLFAGVLGDKPKKKKKKVKSE